MSGRMAFYSSQPAPTPRPLTAIAGLLALWAVLYLVALGSHEFQGEEARRVLPAVTMLETGDFLQPSIGGEPYYNKPPLVNWVVAGVFAVTGVQNEWTARLPSALAMLGMVGVFLLVPVPGYGWRERLLAGFLFLTSFALVEKGRLIELEALYVFLTGAALWLWLAGWSRGNGWRAWLPAGVLLGLAFLLKGPLHFVFFYAAVGGVLLYEKRLLALVRPSHLVAVGLTAGIILAWVIPAGAEDGPSGPSLAETWQNELLPRVIGFDRDWADWGEELLLTAKDFAPWIFLVGLLWTREPQEPRERLRYRGLRLGLLAGTVVLMLLPGYKARYLLPQLPLFAVLVGWAMAQAEIPGWGRAIWRWLLMVLCLVLAVAAGAAFFLLESAQFRAWYVVALALVMVAAFFRWRSHSRTTTALLVQTGLVFVLVSLANAWIAVPERIARQKLRPMAADVAAQLPEDVTVQVYRPGYQQYLFYLERPFAYVLSPEEITGPEAFVLIEKRRLDEVLAQENWQEAEILYEVTDRIGGEVRLVRFRGTRE